jgi:hypothetical protein
VIAFPRIPADRRRAARLLRECVELLLAALPFLFGFVLGALVRMGVGAWLIVLWLLGTMIAGYDAGRGKRQ